MLLDNIRLSVRNLRHRPKRSWLTIVGILIGVAAVVALVSLGQGMQRSITQEFEAFGYNVVMIAGHGEHRLGMGALLGAHTFQLDLAPIKNIPGVEAVGGVLVKTPYISAGRREGYLLTWGIAPELMQSFSNYYKPALGRSLKPGERQTAVLGSTIAQDLGLAVGDKFVIETLEFEVVGILERRADPDVNYAIMIPIATLQELFGEGDKLSLVLIRTAQHGHAGHDVNSIAKEVRRIVREQRGKDDLNVHTTGEMLDLMQNLVGIIQAALGGIAAISLSGGRCRRDEYDVHGCVGAHARDRRDEGRRSAPTTYFDALSIGVGLHGADRRVAWSVRGLRDRSGHQAACADLFAGDGSRSGVFAGADAECSGLLVRVGGAVGVLPRARGRQAPAGRGPTL
jgi:putative ABC transport system permease protein